VGNTVGTLGTGSGHTVTESLSHTVTESQSHTVTQSHSHTVTQSQSHIVTQSHSHTGTFVESCLAALLDLPGSHPVSAHFFGAMEEVVDAEAIVSSHAVKCLELPHA